jgi:hypothetical protein
LCLLRLCGAAATTIVGPGGFAVQAAASVLDGVEGALRDGVVGQVLPLFTSMLTPFVGSLPLCVAMAPALVALATSLDELVGALPAAKDGREQFTVRVGGAPVSCKL